jgi:iron complex outermembrane receptor protein
LGWRKTTSKFALEANYYLMNYTDQLVVTGELNDVGSNIRANVGKSYRTGIELSGLINFSKKVSWNANVTWSVNKNRNFTVFDEDNNASTKNTTIILSPSWVAGSQLTWKAFSNFQVSVLSKYVGKQYLDNNQDENVTLDDYFINDLRLSYQFYPKSFNSIELGLLINNLFDVEYSSNGYGYGGTPYYYPQAGTNFLAMLAVKL